VINQLNGFVLEKQTHWPSSSSSNRNILIKVNPQNISTPTLLYLDCVVGS